LVRSLEMFFHFSPAAELSPPSARS